MSRYSIIVPIDQLGEEPYASVLCFPKPVEKELRKRQEELRDLGISALEFFGKIGLFGVPFRVLGKGFVGIVVAARSCDQQVALKIRRTDADRPDLLHEAQMLRRANAENVAPKLLGSSKNFLLMQLINGEILPSWLEENQEKKVAQIVLRRVLEQCFRLDRIGMDHGELSNAPKHILVDRLGEPWIVDFESASDSRKPANVAALSSFLFISNNQVKKQIAVLLGERNRDAIVAALKKYKKNGNVDNFESVVNVCLE